MLVDEEHTDEDMDEVTDMFRMEDRASSDSDSSADDSDDDDDAKPASKGGKDRCFPLSPC